MECFCRGRFGQPQPPLEFPLEARLSVLAHVSLVALGLAAAACGGTGRTPRFGVVSSPSVSERLAAELPRGADQCVVATPGALSLRRKALVARIGQSGPLAWEAGPVEAYAEARQVQRGGRSSFVALLRVPDAREAQERLARQGPLRLRFGSEREACPGPECWELRGEVIDAETLGIRRGPWEEEARRGAEARCYELAQAYPSALEVSATHPDPDPLGGSPFRIARTLIASDRGVRLVERFEDELAELAVLPMQSLSGSGGLAGVATAVRHRQVGGGHLREVDVRWEDLALAEADERRLRRAARLASRDAVPRDIEEVDVTDPEELARQLRLRRAQLEERGALSDAEAMRRLLERAREVSPGDHELALQLVKVLLAPLGDVDAAREVIEEVLAEGPLDEALWRLWRRRCAQAQGPGALAEALVADGIVTRSSARRAATVLARLGQRADYERVEGAWVAAEALARRAPRVSRVGAGAIDAEVLIETALLLVEDLEGVLPSQAMHVRLVIPRPDANAIPLEEGAHGPEDARVVTWRARDGFVRLGAGSTNAPDHLRGLQRELLRGLPEGPLELHLALVPFGGDIAAPTAEVRLLGSVSRGAYRVERASVRRDFERIRALVAEPLASLEVRLFPPPDLEVELPSEEAAAELVSRAQGEPTLACEADAALVRCEASPDRAASRRAWKRVVRPLL